VWQEIIDKMIRRHAHVFGSEKAANAAEVAQLWQKIKASESGHAPASGSLMDGVKPCLSVLDRAEKLQKTAAKTGFDWQNESQVLDKIAEETAEVREALAENDDEHIDEELGDLLFAVVNLIRFRNKTHASELLRRANLKFENRFRQLEKEFAAHDEDISRSTPERMDQLWEKVKADSKNI
jgi:MazG family protein